MNDRFFVRFLPDEVGEGMSRPRLGTMSGKPLPIAVNWHLEAYCNYGCTFCYASFLEQRKQSRITKEDGVKLVLDLAENGVRKLNFVGGEPMLHPFLDEWIIQAKQSGMTTSIVSNGTKMEVDWLEKMRRSLDWLGLSIDASDDTIHALMGRGLRGEIAKGISLHLERTTEILENAKRLGYGIKLNTVVTTHNLNDDMSELVEKYRPDRWKIFKVLRIEGENEGRVDSQLITDLEFQEYVERHQQRLEGLEGVDIVAEDNADMLGTYAMIDPLGKVYTNATGSYLYSSKSAIEIGFEAAWNEVEQGFSVTGFEERGGDWDFRLPMLQSSEEAQRGVEFGG